VVRRIVLAVVVGLVAIQLVPYRVYNPPVTLEPAWDSPETRELVSRACLDCHSNETRVPWYGRVAPFSWLVRMHVDEAREEMNLSEMDHPQEEAHEAAEEVIEREMPPAYYVLLHPEAKLSDAERRALAIGLEATLGGEEDGHHDDDHHD